MTKLGSIAKQIDDRIAYLADPSTRWVNRGPSEVGECCLVLDCREARVEGWDVDEFDAFSSDAQMWLDQFIEFATAAEFDGEYGFEEAVAFNDQPGRTREEVIDMLQEALEEAILEGV